MNLRKMKTSLNRGVATLIKSIPHPEPTRVQQWLYELTPPMHVRKTCYDCERVTVRKYKFVVVSAAVMNGRPETYLFPADCDGNITDWIELRGSFQGALDPVRALRNIRRRVVP